MDTEASALAFFVRTGRSLRILTLGRPSKQSADTDLSPKELAKLVHVPKSGAWSCDSKSLAVGDTTKGVVIITLREGKSAVKVLLGSHVNTQHLWWSPSSRYLVTHHPPEKATGSSAPAKPNLLVWYVPECSRVATSFCVPKFDGNTCPLLWSQDESVCIRILPPEKGERRSVLHLLDADDLSGSNNGDKNCLFELVENRAAISAEWCPKRSPEGLMRLAVFVSDGRNDMQRVSAPAEVRIYDCDGKRLYLVKKCEVQSGESATLQWSASGEGLLALVETEVDETGVSYYGSTRLLLLSADGNGNTNASTTSAIKDSTPSRKDGTTPKDGATTGATGSKDGSSSKAETDSKDSAKDETSKICIPQELNKGEDGSYLPIQSVSWSPKDEAFVLIRGFQPAQVSMWKYKNGKARMIKVLAEKSHRNTVKFNTFGNVVLVGGFGNLAGEMDFFGMTCSLDESDDCLHRISSAQANCTVSVEWSADGLHVITAVLAPRMRVENGFSVWYCLTGQLKHHQKFDELFEVGLRPHDGSHFEGPQTADLIEAAQKIKLESDAKPKRMAYRPPHARGGHDVRDNGIKAMMLGTFSPRDARGENTRGENNRGGENSRGGENNRGGENSRGGENNRDNRDGATTSPDKPAVESKHKPWIRGQALPEKSSTNNVAQQQAPATQTQQAPQQAPAPQQTEFEKVEKDLKAVDSSERIAAAAAAALEQEETTSRGIPDRAQPPTGVLHSSTASEAAALYQEDIYGRAKGGGPPLGGPPLGTNGSSYPPNGSLAAPHPGLPHSSSIPNGVGAHSVPNGVPLHAGIPPAANGVLHPSLLHKGYDGKKMYYKGGEDPYWKGLGKYAKRGPVKGALPLFPPVAGPVYYPYLSDSEFYGKGKKGCPPLGWQYIDPKGQVQGPFDLDEMVRWNSAGYFKPELKMRFSEAMDFVRFDLLFPHPYVPFHSFPNVPKDFFDHHFEYSKEYSKGKGK